MAALGATAGEDIAAAAGGHAGAEAVLVDTLAVVGLVGTLHEVILEKLVGAASIAFADSKFKP
jgi:hypothetical protein